MKTAITTLTVAAVLCSTGAAICAESESTGARPFIGVLLDPAPLPGLLSKHLGLPVGQGLRIQNVQQDSPADKAGLERDDLIIGFEGQDVHDYERFVAAIRQAGSGTEASLQIVHLGVRKTAKLTLKPFEGNPDWKYPREPQAVQSWRPGRFFRLKPGDEEWSEMWRDSMPSDIDVDVKRFFNELHSYHHSNGEDYDVTIEGNPNDEDSTITVRVGDDNYTTTVKDIDKLPEKYRQAAKDALENARKTSRKRKFDGRVNVLTWQTPPDWRGYFDRLHPRNYAPAPFDRGEELLDKYQKLMEEVLDKYQKQMRELRKSMEELEERQGEILDRISGQRDEKEPKEG